MALSLGEVPTVALTFVLIAAIFVAGFLVLDGLDDDLVPNTAGCNSTAKTACGYAYNATLTMNGALDNIIDFASTWGTILGVAVLLGIVMIGFGMARSKGYV